MKKLLTALFFLFSFVHVSYADGLNTRVFTGTGSSITIRTSGTGIDYHKLTWNKTGTVSGCTVALDSSVDGVTWSAGGVITGQTCTSNGVSTIANTVVNYIRMTVTAFTGTGNVSVTWNGFISNPVSGGTPGSPDTSVQTNQGGVFTGDSNFVWDQTNHRLVVGPPDSTLDPFIQGWFQTPNALFTSSNNSLQVGLGGEFQNNLTGSFIGSYFVAYGNPAGNTTNSLTGMEVDAIANSDNTMGDIIGFTGFAANDGMGRVARLAGGIIQTNGGGSPATLNYGLDFQSQAGVGDTNAAIHIQNQGAGAADYALKIDGGQSQFAGLVKLTGDGEGSFSGSPANLAVVTNNVGWPIYVTNTAAPAGNSFKMYIDTSSNVFLYGSASSAYVAFVDGVLESHAANALFLGYAGSGTQEVAISSSFLVPERDNTVSIGTDTFRFTNLTLAGAIKAGSYTTATNCADSAGAAACGAAPAGAVVIDAAATTVVVSTTAVTANSEIFIQEDVSNSTRLSVTCNTQALSVFNPRVTARTAGVSFTVTVDAGPTTNPLCLDYHIVN